MFFKKSPYDIDHDGLQQKSKKKPITAEAKRLVLWLLVSTVLSFLIYYTCVSLRFPYIFFVYIALAAGFFIGYLIYNQGFVLRDATPEMLDDRLSSEEKEQMLEDAKARMHRSRWMLTIIIPLVVTVLVDVLYVWFLADLIAEFQTILGI